MISCLGVKWFMASTFSVLDHSLRVGNATCLRIPGLKLATLKEAIWDDRNVKKEFLKLAVPNSYWLYPADWTIPWSYLLLCGTRIWNSAESYSNPNLQNHEQVKWLFKATKFGVFCYSVIDKQLLSLFCKLNLQNLLQVSCVFVMYQEVSFKFFLFWNVYIIQHIP